MAACAAFHCCHLASSWPLAVSPVISTSASSAALWIGGFPSPRNRTRTLATPRSTTRPSGLMAASGRSAARLAAPQNRRVVFRVIGDLQDPREGKKVSAAPTVGAGAVGGCRRQSPGGAQQKEPTSLLKYCPATLAPRLNPGFPP